MPVGFDRPRRHGQCLRGFLDAQSRDGLTFTKDVWTTLPGFDPDIVTMNGTTRIYYNIGDQNSGTVYSGVLSGALTPLIAGLIR